MRPVGKTVDNKLVVSGFDLFKLNETIGIPLEESLFILFENNFTVDWLDYFITGIDIGWTYKRIFTKLEEAFSGLSRLDEWKEIKKRIMLSYPNWQRELA